MINRSTLLKKKFNTGFLREKSGYPLSLDKAFKQEIGKNRLPKEYQEVEYIESTGTQWIDSNYAFQNVKLKYEFKYLKKENVSKNTWGVDIANTVANTRQMHGNIYGNNFYYGENGKAITIGTQTLNTIYEGSIEINPSGAKLTMNGLTQNLLLDSNWKGTTFNDYIFTVNKGGYASEPSMSSMQLYYLRFYDQNDNLVRNFVPCYRKSDNEIGMYDTVNRVFYTNQGTGTFLKGNNVDNIITTKAKDLKIYGQSIQRNIPKEYQEVEYIESTGTQYIDTGFIATSLSKMEIIFEDTNFKEATKGIAGEFFSIEYAGRFQIFKSSNTANWSVGLGSAAINIAKESGKHKVVIDAKNVEVFYDDVRQLGNFSNVVSNEVCYLFSSYQQTATLNSSVKIYKVKFFDNDVLVKSFIPCYRKSDNVIGMYDTVNGVFYINQGTGAFLKGNHVNSTPTPENPIEVKSLGENSKNLINGKEAYMNAPKATLVTKNGRQCIRYTTQSNKELFDMDFKPGTQYTFSGYFKCERRELATQSPHSYDIACRIYYTNGSYKDFTVAITEESNKDFRKIVCVSDAGKTIDRIGMYSFEWRNYVYVDINTIQLEEGNTATEYKPYNYIDIQNEDETYTIDLTGHEPLRKIGDYADYIDYKNGRIVRRIGEIENYNGETITTEWISTTGQLSTGATVYYVLETPTYEAIDLPKIQLEKGTNILTAYDEELEASNIATKYRSKKCGVN